MVKSKTIYDCVIVGGGIAGLTAAIYLARFCCNIKVIDNYNSRAALIPLSHNYPGFPKGITGAELLQRLRQQYARFGGSITKGTVINIKRDAASNVFTLKTKCSELQARNVILATGVVDIEPLLPNIKFTVKKGLVRHCLICDGYEVKGKRVAILGNGKKVLKEAFMLSTYSSDITVFTSDESPVLGRALQKKFDDAGIKIISSRITDVRIVKNKINAFKIANNEYTFDTIYSALGTYVRNDLSLDLGVKCEKKSKCIKVDKWQETNIKGLYAVGDIVSGLHQMCVATSQAAIAAVAIYNGLKNFSV